MIGKLLRGRSRTFATSRAYDGRMRFERAGILDVWVVKATGAVDDGR